MEGDDNDDYDAAQIAYGKIGLRHERSTALAGLRPMPNLKTENIRKQRHSLY